MNKTNMQLTAKKTIHTSHTSHTHTPPRTTPTTKMLIIVQSIKIYNRFNKMSIYMKL